MVILSTLFHTFLKIKMSNKKYTLKNEAICQICKFQEHPHIFTKLSGRSFFILFIFNSKFNLINMFGFCGSVGLSGCCGKWVKKQSVGGERSAYRLLLLWLVQYRTRGKCPLCCKDFFLTLLKCRFMLISVFNQHFSPFPVTAITYDRPGSANSAVAWIMISQKALLVPTSHSGLKIQTVNLLYL